MFFCFLLCNLCNRLYIYFWKYNAISLAASVCFIALNDYVSALYISYISELNSISVWSLIWFPPQSLRVSLLCNLTNTKVYFKGLIYHLGFLLPFYNLSDSLSINITYWQKREREEERVVWWPCSWQYPGSCHYKDIIQNPWHGKIKPWPLWELNREDLMDLQRWNLCRYSDIYFINLGVNFILILLKTCS